MKVEIGDKITALGYTFEIAQIMYQDYYQGYWDVEFLDPCGGYHHWKSVYDGGHIVKKGDKEMNKVLEGMKLIQEACEAVDNFSKCKDCPFFKICKRLRAIGKQEFNDDSALIPEWWFDWDDN